MTDPDHITETIARAIASSVPIGCTNSEARRFITALTEAGYRISKVEVEIMPPIQEPSESGEGE